MENKTARGNTAVRPINQIQKVSSDQMPSASLRPTWDILWPSYLNM